MGIKSWWSAVRRKLPFRRTKTRPPTDEEVRAIREHLHGKPVSPARVPFGEWPGFQARKKLSPLEFMEFVSTELRVRPPKENRAARKTIYEARLEILRDKQLTPNQKLQGMSGHDKEVALQAITFGKDDVFRACVASQMVYARKRIKEFSD